MHHTQIERLGSQVDSTLEGERFSNQWLVGFEKFGALEKKD